MQDAAVEGEVGGPAGGVVGQAGRGLPGVGLRGELAVGVVRVTGGGRFRPDRWCGELGEQVSAGVVEVVGAAGRGGEGGEVAVGVVAVGDGAAAGKGGAGDPVGVVVGEGGLISVL